MFTDARNAGIIEQEYLIKCIDVCQREYMCCISKEKSNGTKNN